MPKPSLVTRLNSGLDKIDLLLTSRSLECDSLKDQVADLTRNTKKKRMFQMDTWKEKYEDLFGERALLTERTVEMDLAFTRRIDEIQSQLSPDYKLNMMATEDLTRKKQMSSQARVGGMQKKAPEVMNPVKERYLKLREKEKAVNKAALEAMKEKSPRITKRSVTDRTSKGSFKAGSRLALFASPKRV